MAAIGADILSIGSKKWVSQHDSTFESAPNLDHSAFMLPNVENVRWRQMPFLLFLKLVAQIVRNTT